MLNPCTLVLGGGGLKGLAHIGVFRALEERGMAPSLVIGSSMGSLVASTWAAGMRIRQMEDRALSLHRRDVFRIAHVDMALRRMLSPAIYRSDPLDRILADLVGDRTFQDLPHRLLVNTVDLNSGHQILWGLPGLDDVRVADAVFASCALPGILPPRKIRHHLCADGAVVENLPIRTAASISHDPIIAVDLSGGRGQRRGVERTGFAATYGRGLELVMGRMVENALAEWDGPPVALIRPAIGRVTMFAFNKTPYLIAEGYRATMEALDRLEAPLAELPSGIYPKHQVHVRVDRERCVGCELCSRARPDIFAMKGRKAEVHAPLHAWSPATDALERSCPVGAITAAEPGGSGH